MTNDQSPKFLRIVALAHGLFFFVTGIWPVIDDVSFQFVTGPKFDVWLVKMVGLLFASTGLVVLTALARKKISFEILLLAVSNAFSAIAIDVYYASVDRIWDIYYADALAELIFIILWIAAWRKRQSGNKTA